MRVSLTVTLLFVAGLGSSVLADDGAGKIAPDAETKFDIRVSILEGNKQKIAELGFDLTQEGGEQQSSLSPSEFKSKLSELKKSNLKRLAEPSLTVSLNKTINCFSGGEVKIGEELVRIGTGVDITPTRQPDGSVNLRWCISLNELDYPKTKFLARKKPPVVHRRQSQGNVVVRDRQSAFVIPTESKDQNDVLLLQFYVEESQKPSSTPVNPFRQ
jgi:hypothetical protein